MVVLGFLQGLLKKRLLSRSVPFSYIKKLSDTPRLLARDLADELLVGDALHEGLHDRGVGAVGDGVACP